MRHLYLPLAIFLLVPPLFAASNAVPYVSTPLVPSSVPPGNSAFTLTVNGTGFAAGAVVKWNGSPLTTKFVNQGQLTAAVPRAHVAKSATAAITITNPAPGGGTSSPEYFTVTRPSTSLTFGGVKSAPPATTTIADFNNDGKLDAAGFVEGSQYSCPGGFQSNISVAISLGNGNGTFSAGGSIFFGCIGLNVTGVDLKVADFNNDGRQDPRRCHLMTARALARPFTLAMATVHSVVRRPF